MLAELKAPVKTLARIIGAILRQGLAVAAVLAVVGGAAELGLRAAGVKPQPPAELSNVVPDAWSGFRLRPGVSGEEPQVTNELGMHAPRSYAPAPPSGSLRVAVLGSSVVYGMNLAFADTIPAVIERELWAGGRSAEVLNFGTHAYSIVNVSALLQTYVHQLQPDVVVVVVDLQVGLPRWPALRAANHDGGAGHREARPVAGSRRAGLREERAPEPPRQSAAGAPVDPAHDGPAPASAADGHGAPRHHRRGAGDR